MNYIDKNYSGMQIFSLVVLRVLIGWHFLYEGLVKLFNPYWSSSGFLGESKGFMSDLFNRIVLDPTLLRIVDYLNMWALTAVGLCLILGSFTRIAKVIGMILLALYYLATPPFIGLNYNIPFEGSYLIVNKTLIEFFALLVLFFFPTGRLIGLDRIIYTKKQTIST